MQTSNTVWGGKMHIFLVLYLKVLKHSIMLGFNRFLFEECILSIRQSVFSDNHQMHKIL
jgi:hypothetical protein